MEADRYQQSHTFFIIGLISLIIGLFGLSFSLYLFPSLILGVSYDIPGFIIDWKYWFVSDHSFSEKGAAWAVIMFIFSPSLIALLIADVCSNHIDNQIYHVEKRHVGNKGSAAVALFLKLLMLMVLVFIIARLLEWMIYIPPA